MMWRLILVGVFAFAAQTATACGYLNNDGDTLAYVASDDFDFTIERGGEVAWCYVVRSPEQTTGVCDDGIESAMTRETLSDGTDTVTFADDVWFRSCATAGFTLSGELGAEY